MIFANSDQGGHLKTEIAQSDLYILNITATNSPFCPHKKLSANVSAAASAGRLRFLSFGIGAMLLGSALTPAAYAACASPVGTAGEMIYNADYSTVQFCDGTTWMAMGGGGSTTDARIGTLTANKWCAVNA